MSMNSVQSVKEREKCCGCGICAAVCPVGAIALGIEQNGRSEPRIADNCVSCGVCLAVCPQYKPEAENEEEKTSAVKAIEQGEVLECRLVRTKDQEILRDATSGGFVTTLVQSLLQNSDYESAFLVDSSNYGGVVQTRRVEAGDDLASTQKSRYIQIAHTEELAYILSHREEKIILVGTPCYFQGFLKVVDRNGLNRDNYLLIGLFCDRTMTAHVWDYFDRVFADGSLEAMYFRSKEKNGWPGDALLFLENGEKIELPRAERMDIKDYFMPRCCLDCMEKLNVCADFSVGDDYITGKAGGLGGNTLLIRTDRAAVLWEHYKELFEYQNCSVEEVTRSQHLTKRERDLQKNRAMRLERIHMGENAQYDAIRKQVLARRKKNASFTCRVLSRCKRTIKNLVN